MPENGWMPIETAPKEIVSTDQTPFGDLVHRYDPRFLAWPVRGEIARVRWWETNGGTSNFLDDGGIAVFPTDWRPMPLPPPPKDTKP